MFHRELADRYRFLAAGFAEEGLVTETLGCLAAAMQLDRSSGGDEVRRLLRSLVGLDVAGRPDRSPKVSRLVRYKQKLDEQVARHQVEWHWVKGHSGHRENELADALANRGIDEL